MTSISMHAAGFAQHTIVSSVVLLIAMAVTAMRLTARTKFAVMLLALAKFAIPASLLEPLFARVHAPLPVVFPLSIAPVIRSVAAAQRPAFTVIDVLTAVWMAVAVLLLLRTLILRRRLVSAALRSGVPASTREMNVLDDARRRVKLQTGIDLIHSPLCEAPAVLRVIRPLIVLPNHGPHQGIAELDDRELESLLTHECAHVARHDNLIALGEAALRAVFWFNPLIWIAHRILVAEREKACDEIVADSAERLGTYAGAMAKLCDAIINQPVPGVACMAGSNLKGRMDHLMTYSTLKSKAISHVVALAITLTTLVASTIATAAAPPAQTSGDQLYDITATINKGKDGKFTVAVNVADRITHQLAWTPRVRVSADESITTNGGFVGGNNQNEFFTATVRVSPAGSGHIDVDIFRDGAKVQHASIDSTVVDSKQFEGQPISLNVKDAKIRDVLNTFAKLTGMQIEIAPEVTGTVSYNFVEVPWDEAMHRIITENGYRYHVEGKKVIVTK